MPVYEYRCTKCETELESIVLAGEREPTKCEECGGKLKKLWSRVGVQFSGWGFAKTDSMLPDDPSRRAGRRDFKQIKDKASELFD